MQKGGSDLLLEWSHCWRVKRQTVEWCGTNLVTVWEVGAVIVAVRIHEVCCYGEDTQAGRNGLSVPHRQGQTLTTHVT